MVGSELGYDELERNRYGERFRQFLVVLFVVEQWQYFLVLAGWVRRFWLVERHIVIEHHVRDERQFVVQQFDGLCERGLDIDGLEPEFRFVLGVKFEFVVDAVELHNRARQHDDGHSVLRLDVIQQQFRQFGQHQLELFVEFEWLVDRDHVDDHVQHLGVGRTRLQWGHDHGDHDIRRCQWQHEWKRRQQHDDNSLGRSVWLVFWWWRNSDHIRRNVHHSCQHASECRDRIFLGLGTFRGRPGVCKSRTRRGEEA